MSRRRSSEREEMVVAVVVVGRWRGRWGWWRGWWCWGFGKQDLVSQEKWRELQLSDISK